MDKQLEQLIDSVSPRLKDANERRTKALLRNFATNVVSWVQAGDEKETLNTPKCWHLVSEDTLPHHVTALVRHDRAEYVDEDGENLAIFWFASKDFLTETGCAPWLRTAIQNHAVQLLKTDHGACTDS